MASFFPAIGSGTSENSGGAFSCLIISAFKCQKCKFVGGAKHLDWFSSAQKFKKNLRFVNSFSGDGVYFELANLCAPES